MIDIVAPFVCGSSRTDEVALEKVGCASFQSPPKVPLGGGRRGRGQAGFTLIELGLVVLILGTMVAIAVPRFGNRAHAQLRSETRKMALAFRYLRHAAILNGRSYRLAYDLDNHTYWAEVSEVTSPDTPDEDDDIESDFFPVEEEEVRFARDVDGPLRERKFPEPIGFSDVNLPLIAGKVYEGIVYSTFYPDGTVDVAVVHLDNGEDVYTLYVLNQFTGQVFVEPGYLSWN